MRHPKFFLLLALAVIAVALPSRAQSPAPRKVASVEGITEYNFDNGLRALFFPDPSQSKVTVNMTVLVGSRQEGYGETGMAHLLEHMVFKGTPRHPDVPRALQEHGASFNGSTSADRVNYYETLTATDENLEFAIDLEADRLVNSYIRKSDLDSEMTVVRNEFERGENSPTGVLSERIEAAAYDWHNYGKPTIGNRTDIERVPINNLQAFYRKFYQPDNIVLVVAGRFDEAKAVGLVQKYFGPIPRPARKLDITWTEEPPQDGERQVTLRRVGEVPSVGVAYHIPAASHDDAAPLEVLASILGSQPSGRLSRALLDTKIAASANASARLQHDPGLFFLTATAATTTNLEEVTGILIATAESIVSNGVTVEEVDRAKHLLANARERALADPASFGVAISTPISQGDWRLFFLDRDRIEKVTPIAVEAVAARYLVRNNRTIGRFIPTDKPERIEIPAAPDIPAIVRDYKGHEAFAAGELFEPTPANIEAHVQRLDLTDGIKATFLQKKTRDSEVHLNLTLHYGDAENLKGYEAVAPFLPELMLRGTHNLSRAQISDKLGILGATISAGAGGGRGGRGGGGGGGALGAITFSVQARRETLPATIDILREVLREPLLPSDEFDRLRSRSLVAIQESRSDPALLAGNLLARELNPAPPESIHYTPTVDESIERLKNATASQVVQLYQEYLGAQCGELTIVGDFEPDKCIPRLKAALAGWKPAKSYARIPNPVTNQPAGSRQDINTPDKANATYVAGLVFPMRDDSPDYPALVMGNYILGSGTLSSRLGTRIRQKDGLSYGVTSSFAASALDPHASFGITAIANPKNVEHVASDVQEELARILKEGVTAEELDKARQGYLEALDIGRSSDAALAGTLSNLRHLDRTMKYEAEFEQKIKALTPAQIQAALAKYLDPKKLVIVTAGDFGTKTATDVR